MRSTDDELALLGSVAEGAGPAAPTLRERKAGSELATAPADTAPLP